MTRSLFTLLAAFALTGLVRADDKDKPNPAGKPSLAKQHRVQIEVVKNDAWKVTLTVDHPDRTYQLGEEVIIRVTSEEDGYLYVFNQDAEGNMVCLLPNKIQSRNEIRAGQEVTIPDPSDNFRIKAAEPAGKERIIAIVTKHPSPEIRAEDYARGGPTRVANAKFRRLVVVASGGSPNDLPPIAGPDTAQGTAAQNIEPIQQAQEKIRQENPEQYQAKQKEWAVAQIEITTVHGKPIDKPTQDAPIGKPLPGKPLPGKPAEKKVKD